MMRRAAGSSPLVRGCFSRFALAAVVCSWLAVPLATEAAAGRSCPSAPPAPGASAPNCGADTAWFPDDDDIARLPAGGSATICRHGGAGNGCHVFSSSCADDVPLFLRNTAPAPGGPASRSDWEVTLAEAVGGCVSVCATRGWGPAVPVPGPADPDGCVDATRTCLAAAAGAPVCPGSCSPGDVETLRVRADDPSAECGGKSVVCAAGPDVAWGAWGVCADGKRTREMVSCEPGAGADSGTCPEAACPPSGEGVTVSGSDVVQEESCVGGLACVPVCGREPGECVVGVNDRDDPHFGPDGRRVTWGGSPGEEVGLHTWPCSPPGDDACSGVARKVCRKAEECRQPEVFVASCEGTTAVMGCDHGTCGIDCDPMYNNPANPARAPGHVACAETGPLCGKRPHTCLRGGYEERPGWGRGHVSPCEDSATREVLTGPEGSRSCREVCRTGRTGGEVRWNCVVGDGGGSGERARCEERVDAGSWVGKCVPHCPAGHESREEVNGRWEYTYACAKRCAPPLSAGVYPNCECPAGAVHVNGDCVACSGGRHYDRRSGRCECPTYRPVYDPDADSCGCPEGESIRPGSNPPYCEPDVREAPCPNGGVRVGGVCPDVEVPAPCPNGEVRVGGVCPDDVEKPVTECSGGMEYDEDAGKCDCPDGTSWGRSVFGTHGCLPNGDGKETTVVECQVGESEVNGACRCDSPKVRNTSTGACVVHPDPGCVDWSWTEGCRDEPPCPAGEHEANGACECDSPKVRNPLTGACVRDPTCPFAYNWERGECPEECVHPYVGLSPCVNCAENYSYVRGACRMDCLGDRRPDDSGLYCVCPDDRPIPHGLNNNLCRKACGVNEVWDGSDCVCKADYKRNIKSGECEKKPVECFRCEYRDSNPEEHDAGLCAQRKLKQYEWCEDKDDGCEMKRTAAFRWVADGVEPAPTEWTPPENTECESTEFQQTRTDPTGCTDQLSRNSTGTKTDEECDFSPSLICCCVTVSDPVPRPTQCMLVPATGTCSKTVQGGVLRDMSHCQCLGAHASCATASGHGRWPSLPSCGKCCSGRFTASLTFPGRGNCR